MRVFVPVPDDWNGGPGFTGEIPVPYRAGLPLWQEPQAAATSGLDQRPPDLPKAA